MTSAQDLLPLTEAHYYILLSLYAAPSHGYGMMQQIELVSNGRVKIGPGTLYTALGTLLKKRWITPVNTSPDVDARRKMYTITPDGRNMVKSEMERLAELLTNGQKLTGVEEGAAQ